MVGRAFCSKRPLAVAIMYYRMNSEEYKKKHLKSIFSRYCYALFWYLGFLPKNIPVFKWAERVSDVNLIENHLVYVVRHIYGIYNVKEVKAAIPNCIYLNIFNWGHIRVLYNIDYKRNNQLLKIIIFAKFNVIFDNYIPGCINMKCQISYIYLFVTSSSVDLYIYIYATIAEKFLCNKTTNKLNIAKKLIGVCFWAWYHIIITS